MKNIVNIIEKKTGQKKIAVYGYNRQGNLRYNVDGKFMPDKIFDRRYSIFQDKSDELNWRVHTCALFKEIVNCGGPAVQIVRLPLSILQSILAEVAKRAIELNDPKLNALMCRLTLYEQADPYSKEYNKDFTEKTIKSANL